ncbi:Atxe2 family lasso peptide isopeptidase [Sphingosinicella sp. BN140058]|uniref:Atxe2 family lasso peptide isopeptidase n=1 Tax=Sphingosinicella sp. BN140058 TaxID=1892855 RepID=UPI0010120FEC|nr:Atxe2 family lasso peptide isopeptidase [Sphingosinicella sp. BN140058]QAY78188.1 Atxe2 family lasso peptide isopeptidase [Sphingosinicella sp. BN140058]
MVMLRLLAAAAAALPGVPNASSGDAAAGSCPMLPPAAAAAGPRRPVEPEDLARLLDIGPSDHSALYGRLFTLSPDGRRAAFQLRRADPGRNLHCLAMAVIELRPGAVPRIVDRGGDLIRWRIEAFGKADFPTGVPIAVTPRWAPDGRWIAFLKRKDDVTQVWRAGANGEGSRPLTASQTDVEDFRILPDATILYVTRPGLARAHAAIASEGRTGFHYDDRFAPSAARRPFPPAPVPPELFVQEHGSVAARPARPEEAARIADAGDMRETIWTSARTIDGASVSIRAAGPPHSRGTMQLVVDTQDGRTIACGDDICAAASRPWWTPDGRRVRFLAREGWARSETSIYEWEPGAGSPKQLYRTRDVLVDCVPAGTLLVCLREGSLTPRRLERLDPETGERQLLFDPNPEWPQLALGAVRRLRWRNAFAIETVGDLVLPVGYRPGTACPLVVVQYDTRGFLRGGTGDEYPIQALAGRGYAVLSVSRPASLGDIISPDDPAEAARLDVEGFTDRLSALSSVESGVRMLISEGIADPARIGITGLSDGAVTAAFALLHSRLFSAAAISSCCLDTSMPARVGPAAARHFQAEGFPRLTEDGAAFWDRLSLRRNAPRVRVPLLIQTSDDELLSAIESFTALREVGAPADMYVFPGEHHVKWQPAHRLAVYRRALDWFDFWLRGVRSADPARREELRHWDQLRTDAAASGG